MIPVEQYLAVEGRTVRLEHAGPRNGALAARLATMAGWLLPVAVEGEAERLRVAAAVEHGSLTFLGAVEGRLREPLVELLRALATGAPEYDGPATPALAREVTGARALELFVTARCPFCPRAVATAGRLAVARSDWSLRVRRIDEGSPPPDVLAVPTLRSQGRERSGPIGEMELLRWLQ